MIYYYISKRQRLLLEELKILRRETENEFVNLYKRRGLINTFALSTCPTLQRKSHLCIPRKEIARPQFHIHVFVSDLFVHIFSFSRKEQTDRGNL